ncbi:MAG: translocation/assembly module TamB domain-containing protein [Syntrophaceae bacterium]|nr:translocation/assembly module TamB domain-containing protein [Syntrophaceae bacterium]
MTLRKKITIASLLTGIMLMILAGLAVVSGSEWFLRHAAGAINQGSGGMIFIEGARGTLYGPLCIDRIIIRTETMHMEMKAFELDWQPGNLIRRHLSVTQIKIETFLIREVKPSPEPPKLPSSLRLPVTFSLPRVIIQKLILEKGDTKFALKDIRINLEKSAAFYQLTLIHAFSPWGKATSTVKMADTAPFAIRGNAEITLPDEHHLQLNAEGTLAVMILHARISTPLQANLNAQITAFTATPVRSLDMTASRLDPHIWEKTWPRADITVRSQVEFDHQGNLQGYVSLENEKPGRLNSNLLPLKRFSSRLTGKPDELFIGNMVIDLGRGGLFAGGGNVQGKTMSFNLTTGNFNPHFIDSHIRSMLLAGRIDLGGDKTEQYLRTNLTYRDFRLVTDLSHRGKNININQLELVAKGGSLATTGAIGLTSPHPFEIRSRLVHFNPADWGAYPAADLNASLTGTGMLSPQPRGDLSFTIAPSRLRGQILAGHGRFAMAQKRISNVDARFEMGGNEITAHGSFGAKGDHLSWRIKGSNMAAIHPQFGGNIQAGGNLRGTLDAPAGDFQAKASDLRWGKSYRIANLHIRGQLIEGWDGKADLDMNLSGLQTQKLDVAQGSLIIHGKRSNHRIETMLRGHEFETQAVLSGAWLKNRWTGKILVLENQGTYRLSLLHPASLSLGIQQQRLDGAEIDFMNSRIRVYDFYRRLDSVSSRGEFRSIALMPLVEAFGITTPLKTSLVLSGKWDFNAAERFNGQASVWREAGDVTLPSEAGIDVELSRLFLDIHVRNNRIHTAFDASGTKLGLLNTQVRTTLTRRNGLWGLSRGSPISGIGKFKVASIAWLVPFVDKAHLTDFDGALAADFMLAGTVEKPSVIGQLTGQSLRFSWPEQGLKLGNGTLDAELSGDRLLIKRFRIHGGEGLLAITGYAGWRGNRPDISLEATANRLQVLTRPDRKLVISGDAQSSVKHNTMYLQGNLKADRALIELPKEETPRRSPDVVVIGRPPEQKTTPPAIHLDLQLDLGNQFYLKGHGLDAQLAGSLKVMADPHEYPKAYGSIRVVKGHYAAYGQRLQIEHGIVDFRGPLDNPGLDILAMRKNQPVEAGVAVRGTVLAPAARLVSNPDVPDSDKLSWLVLGRSMESASGGDFDLLATAAGALLSAGESATLQARIAHATGLDVIGLRSGETLESTMLTMGKRLSSRLYVSYEQGLTGVDNLLKLNYALTRRLSLQLQTGRENVLDLIYSFTFD